MRNGSANNRRQVADDRVALYLRVSTEEQHERQSIDTQREFGINYADLHQLPIHGIYADDGISGTVPIEERTEGRPNPRSRPSRRIQPTPDLQTGSVRPRHPVNPQRRR
jgi:hypothetical protein